MMDISDIVANSPALSEYMEKLRPELQETYKFDGVLMAGQGSGVCTCDSDYDYSDRSCFDAFVLYLQQTSFVGHMDSNHRPLFLCQTILYVHDQAVYDGDSDGDG